MFEVEINETEFYNYIESRYPKFEDAYDQLVEDYVQFLIIDPVVFSNAVEKARLFDDKRIQFEALA